MAIIFISYAQYDKPIADSLAEIFTVGELRPFMASQIRGGTSWRSEVRAAIRSASVVVSIMSVRSVMQPWVNFEAGGAWVAGKALIPVCFGSMSKAKLPSHYTEWQARDIPEELRQLCEDVIALFPRDKEAQGKTILRRSNSQKRRLKLSRLITDHDKISLAAGGTAPGDTYPNDSGTSPGDSPYYSDYPTVRESSAHPKEPQKT